MILINNSSDDEQPGDTLSVDPLKDPSHTVTIPQGHVWLQGDNYASSMDSREYGPVPMGLLVGKVAGRVIFIHLSIFTIRTGMLTMDRCEYTATNAIILWFY